MRLMSCCGCVIFIRQFGADFVTHWISEFSGFGLLIKRVESDSETDHSFLGSLGSFQTGSNNT